MQKLSERFQVALSLSHIPRYKLAILAGLEPSILSKLITGQRPVGKVYEAKLIGIGRALGLKLEEVFQKTSEAKERAALAKELGVDENFCRG